MTAPAVRPHRPVLEPTRALSRVVILLSVVLAFVSLRIDRFVRIAGETDWVPTDVRIRRADSTLADYCLRNACPRLPEEMIPTVVLLGLATTLVVLIAVANANRYFVRRLSLEFAEQAADAELAGLPRPGARSPWPSIVLWVLWVTILLLGVGLAIARGIAAYGNPGIIQGIARDDVTSDVVMMFAVAQFVAVLIALAVLARLVATQGQSKVDWRGVSTVVADQRATIIIMAVFAAFVLFLPVTSDQVADALRALDGSEANNHGAGILFVIAAGCLLSATALETWRAIERANARTGQDSIRRVIRWWVWLSAGLGLSVLGIILFQTSLLGGGLAAIGILLIVFGILEFGHRKTAAANEKNDNVAMLGRRRVMAAGPERAASRSRVRTSPNGESTAARYVAAIPLAALSIALTGAAAESIVTNGFGLQTIAHFATAAAFGGFAVYLTRQLLKKTQENHDEASNLVLPVLIIIAIVLLWAYGGQPVANVVAGIALMFAFGYHLWVIGRRERDDDPASSHWTIGIAITMAAFVTIGLHLAPVGLARSLGPVTLILVFVSGLLGIGFLLTRLSVHFTAPRALEWFGVRNLPVFAMLLAVWVVAGFLVPGNLHDVRVLDGARAAAVPTTFESAFRTWVRTQPEFRADTTGEGREFIPLVLVASHGGGVRAAYWTGVVLDCLVGVDVPDPELTKALPQYGTDCKTDRRTPTESLASARRIFIASGVSGGAVGIAAYSEQLLSGGLNEDWIGDRLSNDLLAPVIGWALFHDFPNHILGLPGGGCDGEEAGEPCALQDRAAVLEQAIDIDAQGGDEMLLRSTWEARVRAVHGDLNDESAVPLLVFNSSTTSDPLRTITSAANLASWPVPPSTRGNADAFAERPVSDASETIDLLCDDQDLRISTAATLAARFPYVSPSGLLHGFCDDPGSADVKADDKQRCRTTDTCQLQLADGGYLENSGLMTIAEILPTLQHLVAKQNANSEDHKIAIVVVDIDNDYREIDPTPAKAASVGETVVPPDIILSFGAMESAAYGFVQQRVPGACFISLAPARQPGIQAPLGWSLSDSSRANLTGSLIDSSQQAGRVQDLQYWLRPDQSWYRSAEARVAEQAAQEKLERCVPG